MIQKIIFALLLGIIATLVVMQNDPTVQRYCQEKFIESFEQSGACCMRGTVKHVNFFSPSIELVDVAITPKVGIAWYWKAKTFSVSCSWLHLLLSGSLAIYVDIGDMHSETEFDNGNLAVMEHINALYNAPAAMITTFIKELNFKRARIVTNNKQFGISTSLYLHSHSKKINNLFKTHLYLLDGAVNNKDKEILTQLQADICIDSISNGKGFSLSIQGSGSCDCMLFAPQARTCFFSGSWQKGAGICTFKKADESLVVDPITITKNQDGFNVDAVVHAALADVYRLLLHKEQRLLEGHLSGTVSATITPQAVDGTGSVELRDAEYAGIKLFSSCSTQCTKKGNLWQGTCSLLYDVGMQLDGSWQWDQQLQACNFDLINKDTMHIPYVHHWKVASRQGSFHLDSFQGGAQLVGRYACTAVNDQLEEEIKTAGTLVVQPTTFTFAGAVDALAFEVEGDRSPKLRLKKCVCTDTKTQQQLLILQEKEEGSVTLRGSLSMPFMRKLSLTRWGYDMQGEGVLDLEVTVDSLITATMHLVHGNIRLPHTYNFIHGLDATIKIDPVHNRMDIEDVACTLYKGSITCKQARVMFDDHYHLAYAHVPLAINSCLLNFSKDLFAIVSGRVLLTKKGSALPLLKSTLFIEHAQLKENIFSQEFQKNLFKNTGVAFDFQGTDLVCDIAVETVSPIHIKTDFLETYAKVNLKATHSIKHPEVSGSIELVSGTLFFPYKPLFITKGHIYFVPQQSIDPLIELTAKNSIKKHTVAMSVSGSLSVPYIMLESTPPLTEEQIVSLLLVGSHEESLNIIMPALVMQNITTLIFGNEQSSLKLDRYFKTLLKPLKNVHLVPSFTDQTGRGGLRGAIEIDVNERWRAMIQKNFSLTEDTRFELEYAVSDDISVRGFRDERRDIGGEVEMKWKF